MKLKYLRSVANGDIYECSCCHAEILVQPKTVTPYCSECGAEFYEEADEITEEGEKE